METVTIPASVTEIGEDAFHDCDNLTKVTIPKNCKKGKYKIAVKAAETKNYLAGNKTVTINIK